MRIIKQKNKQSGVALAIGMILLLIISIVGITSMKSAILQEKMAANLKNRELADAAALSLLVGVESWLFEYYETGNGILLLEGSPFIVDPYSTESSDFRSLRNLSNGFTLPSLNVNAEYGGILADEPRFIIESISPSAVVVGGSDIGVGIEFDSASAGSSGGTNPADGNSGLGKLLIFKIIVKSTDTTGHLFSMFESVMSVKVK